MSYETDINDQKAINEVSTPEPSVYAESVAENLDRIPRPDQPDMLIFIDGHHEAYRYLIVDRWSTFGHRGCGKLPTATGVASLLYAASQALKSVSHNHAIERLKKRYGYANARDAKASGRRLIVDLFTLDRDLAELGNLIIGDVEVLEFMTVANDSAYKFLAADMKRFDCEFHLLRPDSDALKELKVWAESMLMGAVHDGPIMSPKRHYVFDRKSCLAA